VLPSESLFLTERRPSRQLTTTYLRLTPPYRGVRKHGRLPQRQRYAMHTSLLENPHRCPVLVTSHEGFSRDLRRTLRRFGDFHAAGFRNVLLGEVASVEPFLLLLEQELEKKPFCKRWLARVLPLHLTFPIDPATFATDVESHLLALAPTIVGKSFHVRVERRGHKGVLNTRTLELRLGEFLWSRVAALGPMPVISFEDPDVVVAMEIIGAVGGLALVTRALRQRFPFVKID
jgi:tRNA(Ser,Leu) C12 N-acetylase TAN1